MSKNFFDSIDWQALREQKDALLTVQGELTERPEYDAFECLVGLLDCLMDQAEKAGYPVVWSSECENCDAIVASDKLTEIRDEGTTYIKVCTECLPKYPECEHCQEYVNEDLIDCRDEMYVLMHVCEKCWDSLYDRGLATAG